MDIRYSPKNEAIIDVTKPPYNADNTGKVDCTQALRQAIDDILRPNIEGIEKAKQELLAIDDPNAKISFEIRKENNILYVIFPKELEPTKILYFPNGTYLVSDTITYTLDNLRNIYQGVPTYELNRQIHFKGESRDGVTIKLQDNCKGFEYGTRKPVVSFMRADSSNIAMTNTFEDITIDTGCGNAGAVGLVFFGNNTGAVRNVKIVSSDSQLRGYAGLLVENEIVSGCYVKDVEVTGFNFGVRVTPTRNFAVFENITVKNQKETGFYIGNTIISIRNLKSENFVRAVEINGQSSHAVIVDSELYGGNEIECAIKCPLGNCFVRNVKTSGYGIALVNAWVPVCPDPYISEYVSEDIHTAFDTKMESQPIPVKDTPEFSWSNNPDDWACVTDFGAVGDGKTDDTTAIQAAMNSNKKYIYFQPRKYLIDGSIIIPPNVERVNYMFCDFVAGENLKNSRDKGAFVVTGDEGKILLEDVFTWEDFHGYFRFIQHAGKRTLVMSDLHTQTAAMYFNTVKGGEVYIENCACTIGGDQYREVTGFSFEGQKVWARHINPERSFCEILNDGGQLWLMGFKTENTGTSFKTINGGHTEVLGGTISMGRNSKQPAIINDNSTVSVVASTNGYLMNDIFPKAVEETQNGETKILKHDEFPLRLFKCYRIPLYVGRNKE